MCWLKKLRCGKSLLGQSHDNADKKKPAGELNHQRAGRCKRVSARRTDLDGQAALNNFTTLEEYKNG